MSQQEFAGFTPDNQGVDPELPDDIQESLRICSGDEAAILRAQQETKPKSPFKESAQDTWLRRGEKSVRITHKKQHKVRSFDLSNDQDCAAYEEILNQAGDPKNKIMVEATPPIVMPSPGSSRGFIDVITIRVFTYEFEEVKVPPPQWTPVSDKSVRESVAKPELPQG